MMPVALGLLMFWIAVFSLIAVSASKVKPVPSENQIVLSNLAGIRLTTNNGVFTDSDGHTWRLGMSADGNSLQYGWSEPSYPEIIVWDSTIASCGANLVNYNMMMSHVSSLPTIYTPQRSVVLAVTPLIFVQSYGAVQFRLVLYTGDVRIESTTGDGKYWSIFGPASNGDPFYGLQNWPMGSADVVQWVNFSLAQNVSAQFLASGDLVVRTSNATVYLWSASGAPAIPIACV